MPHRIIILILSFLICSLLGAVLTLATRRFARRKQTRLEKRLGIADYAPVLPELTISPEYRAAQGSVGTIDRAFSRFVTQTGLELAPETAFLVALAAGLLSAGVVLLWRDNFLETMATMAVGMSLVFAYYFYRRARRTGQIREQLPDVMDLLARAVRAGESLDQAIQLVGQTIPRPLGPEFTRCAQQLDMGLSIDAAMQSMSRRAPVTEIRILASSLMVQRKTGGSLPITLERLSIVIRDRLNYRRQFKAATGAGRISTVLIGGAAPVVALYLLAFQRNYVHKFLETFGGMVLLTTAVLLQVIGYIWVYKLLKSDY